MSDFDQEEENIRLMLKNIPKRRQEALERYEAELANIDEQENEYHRRIAEIRCIQMGFGKRW
jgi:hypothetical protein